ncbi:MAG: DEAD/DEAH box helicase family protein [Synergistaceae bacterium]|jgi:type III restriction enzyme|nr:DEAD/DEAH box helicase family protein [Synergistaceae bacterium]
MELKQFQRDVIDNLSRFLALLQETGDISKSFGTFWEERGVNVGYDDGMESYKHSIPNIPDVCLKVPTGGGKTFIAASAIKVIFDSIGETKYIKNKAVVWLVPSDSILEQTLKNLSNTSHPYRQRINADFSGRVEVYSKEQLLSGQNFNPTAVSEHLSIFVLSYDSFRAKNKEGRKAYQENGSLAPFGKVLEDLDDEKILLEKTDDTALIQAIRYLNPVLIVDESHHAATTLSEDMLKNFNPCFILNLTATPKAKSNIISFVSAPRLKRENMVKLPVIVCNHESQTDVFADAIKLRGHLEAAANHEKKRSGRYIRPIVLFQAQPKNNEDTETFEKIKRTILDIGISEEQIAIKTSGKNELKGVDLLSSRCPIRYIITVNALKEGWDCPFAYILATVANRSSIVEVEQILGRILRLPHVTKNTDEMLNMSYVFTSSNAFQETLQRIITGLNNAGMSEQDYRVGEIEDFRSEEQKQRQRLLPLEEPENQKGRDENEVDAELVRECLNETTNVSQEVGENGETPPMAKLDEKFIADAIKQGEEYAAGAERAARSEGSAIAPEERSYIKTFPMRDEFAEETKALLLPQFMIDSPPNLFEKSGRVLLKPIDLTEGFSLKTEDTKIDFSAVDSEIVVVDVKNENDSPKAWRLSDKEKEIFKQYLKFIAPERRIGICKRMILEKLDKMDALDHTELSEYVGRILSGFDQEQLEDLKEFPHRYCEKIRRKIETLIAAHSEHVFKAWIEHERIKCVPTYALKSEISPAKYTSSYTKTLYKAEEEMNKLETRVAWELDNMSNIKWWHRNISRTGFNINGYVNAYPDIIAMTRNGRILMIEPKGDHLENSESTRKAHIGSVWANKAGEKYRYYMVFDNKNLKINGATHFDEFLGFVRGL